MFVDLTVRFRAVRPRKVLPLFASSPLSPPPRGGRWKRFSFGGDGEGLDAFADQLLVPLLPLSFLPVLLPLLLSASTKPMDNPLSSSCSLARRPARRRGSSSSSVALTARALHALDRSLGAGTEEEDRISAWYKGSAVTWSMEDDDSTGPEGGREEVLRTGGEGPLTDLLSIIESSICFADLSLDLRLPETPVATPITSEFGLSSWDDHGTSTLSHDGEYWQHPSPSARSDDLRIPLLPFPSFPFPSFPFPSFPLPSTLPTQSPKPHPPPRSSSHLHTHSTLSIRLPSPTWPPTPSTPGRTVDSPTAILDPSNTDSYLIPLSVPRMPKKAAELLGLVPRPSYPSHERTDSGTSSTRSLWSSCLPRPSMSSNPSTVLRKKRKESFEVRDVRRATSLPEIKVDFLPPRTSSKFSEGGLVQSPLAESFAQARRVSGRLFGRKGRSASQPTEVEAFDEVGEANLVWDAPLSWVVGEGVNEVEVLQKEKRKTRDAWEMESAKLRLRISESLGQ